MPNEHPPNEIENTPDDPKDEAHSESLEAELAALESMLAGSEEGDHDKGENGDHDPPNQRDREPNEKPSDDE